MKPVTITHTSPGGATWTVIMDRRDVAYYRRYNGWQKHKKGLIRYDGQRKGKGAVLFHRAILEAEPTDFVEFKNGNKFDVRRENIRVRNDAEWRARKRKPFIRKRTGNHPAGIYFVTATTVKKSGRSYTYKYAAASFCFQRKEHQCKRVMKPGFEIDAMLTVLRWRRDMIAKHKMQPNKELLGMIAVLERMDRSTTAVPVAALFGEDKIIGFANRKRDEIGVVDPLFDEQEAA